MIDESAQMLPDTRTRLRALFDELSSSMQRKDGAISEDVYMEAEAQLVAASKLLD